MTRKIIVGLSGGVDSSISLLLLKKQGWQAIGVHLKMPKWKKLKEKENIAKKICQRINIPYLEIDVHKEFKEKIVNYFIAEYQNGRTPNPCVICNSQLKFKKLLEIAKERKINYIATGHYACTRDYELLIAKDRSRDQSYYLCFLSAVWFHKIIFPLGGYTKTEVYQLAQKEDLNYWQKSQSSQDFCYLKDSELAHFLEKEIGIKEGLIVDTQSSVLGKHKGLHFYTLGQRKGIELGGGPYFVKGFDIKNNYLIVTKNKNDLHQKKINLSPFNFISGKIPNKPIKVMAKVRYQQTLQQAVLYPKEDNQLKIIFQKPVLAVTPGQICAFYKNDVCLGGGVIVK